MLLTHAIALPLLNKTETKFSRYQQDAINANLRYKLMKMMLVPDDCNKEIRLGMFDIKQTGFFNKKLTMVPRLVETPDSYLILQVINNRNFGLDMYLPNVRVSDNIKYITNANQSKFSSDHYAKNANLGINYLFRLENFDEQSTNLVFWFNYYTDIFAQSNKTSVVIELEPNWFTSHAYDSNGEKCCQFNHKIYYLDPNSSFNKSCNDPLQALEFAKVNVFPMIKGDALEPIKKQSGKFI